MKALPTIPLQDEKACTRGSAKVGIWGNFQGLTEATGGGGSETAKIEATSFMDGP